MTVGPVVRIEEQYAQAIVDALIERVEHLRLVKKRVIEETGEIVSASEEIERLFREASDALFTFRARLAEARARACGGALTVASVESKCEKCGNTH